MQIGGGSNGLEAVQALQVFQATEAGMAAAQESLEQTTGGGAAPIVSSSATAPGALEVFA
jgi:hypothetical protein